MIKTKLFKAKHMNIDEMINNFVSMEGIKDENFVDVYLFDEKTALFIYKDGYS